MSTRAEVNETCGCGASFRYAGEYPLRATKEWREQHSHESPQRPIEVSSPTGDHDIKVAYYRRWLSGREITPIIESLTVRGFAFTAEPTSPAVSSEGSAS